MSRAAALLAPLSLCILTACGGGGGGSTDGINPPPPPPPPAEVKPEGLWHGSAKSNLDALKASLITDGQGFAYAVLNDAHGAPMEALFMSNLNSEAFVPGQTSFTGQGYYRHVSGGFYQSIASSVVSAASGVTKQALQFQVRKGLDSNEVRAVSVDYDKGFDQALTVERVAGAYSSTQSGHAMGGLSISLADGNRALLSDNPACGFSHSRITASSSDKNLFSVVGILSGPACGFQGPATGVGYATVDAQGAPVGFTIALRESSGQAFFVFQGHKR